MRRILTPALALILAVGPVQAAGPPVQGARVDDLAREPLANPGAGQESFAGRTTRTLDSARVASLKAFVAQAMSELGVPGVSVALVDHGQVVFEGGLGVRELGKPEAVDSHTLFMIGPITEALTSLLLARLVDQGRLDWDEPATTAYPGFRLGGQAGGKPLLVRHLACGCAGLPRRELERLLGAPPGTSAAAVFDGLARASPDAAPGQAFQDSEAVASAAGYIGAHLVRPRLEWGDAYDAVMQQEILRPLGMADTTFDPAAALGGNHASPHGADSDGRPALADVGVDATAAPYRPAVGAWSSAHDLARYVAVEITEGQTPEGARPVSAAALLARRRPMVAIAPDADFGLGLEIDRRWGLGVIGRTGGLNGFQAAVVAIPAAQVGAVILTNAEDGRVLADAFARRLVETVYDGRDEAAGDLAAGAARLRAERAQRRAGLAAPPTPDQAAVLAVDYRCADLGRLAVRRAGAEVTFDFGAWRSRMAARREADGGLTFVTVSPAVGGYEFHVGVRDGRRALFTREGQREYVYLEAG